MNQRQRNLIERNKQALIHWFNTNYSVGDTVEVADDFGNLQEDVVTAPAILLASHTPVAYFKAKRCYLLERVMDHKKPKLKLN